LHARLISKNPQINKPREGKWDKLTRPKLSLLLPISKKLGIKNLNQKNMNKKK